MSAGFEKFPQKLVNVRYDENKVSPLESETVKAAQQEAEEALGTTGRVLLRKSGTEPLIRVMVESESDADTIKWAETIADAVKASA